MKKKILLLSDDLRMHSGVATESRELVLGTVANYDWVQIAGAISHPDKGKVINMDAATSQLTGVPDAKVTLYPVDGYGNEELLFNIIDREKPDAIMHFTDPRFWGWLYAIERQIRSKIPLTYYNIWDDIPYPMYNRPYYESCDLLMSISKQTYNINKWVLGPNKCFTLNGVFDSNGNLIPFSHGKKEDSWTQDVSYSEVSIPINATEEEIIKKSKELTDKIEESLPTVQSLDVSMKNKITSNTYSTFKILNTITTDNKTLIHYVPHGINSTTFHPIPADDSLLKKKRKELLNGKDYEFVIFYNSRNVQRKRTSNIILAFKAFCDNLPKEKSAKCVLVLKTEVRQEAGTDLIAVKEALCPEYDIVFATNMYSPEEMNLLYNISDVTINLSSNEGFGLSTAESIMAGTPIIVAVTGGLQDQIGQVKDDGSPIEFELNFGSNNIGKYKKHGVWAYPVYTKVQCIQGSIPTPYIFDDMTRWEDAAEGMMYWYLAGKETRELFGMKGRQWALNEGGINAENMCAQFVKCMDYTLKNFQPVKQFGIFTENDYVGNLMPGGMGFEIPTLNQEQITQQIQQDLESVKV